MSTTTTQIGAIARRAVTRTSRQPASIIPPLIFPVALMLVNAGGLRSSTQLPGFPTDSFLAFALAVPFIQGALFSTMNAGDVEEHLHDAEHHDPGELSRQKRPIAQRGQREPVHEPGLDIASDVGAGVHRREERSLDEGNRERERQEGVGREAGQVGRRA